MKRVYSLILAAMMLVTLLAGCGTTQTTTPDPAPSGTGTADSQEVDWPTKPVTLVCPFSAGGSSDLMCRILAESLTKELGQPVVVENRTGGGGFVAWSELVKTKDPDGYTFTTMNTPGIVICKDNPDNPRDFDCFDFTLLANQVTDYNVLAWRADETRWSDFASFVEYAKQNDVLFGSSDSGLTGDDYTISLRLNEACGTKLTVVATEGSKDNETMLLNKSADVLIGNVSDVLTGKSAGTFTVSCVFAPERVDLISDVPTCEELGFGEIYGFASRGYAFPAGVDERIVEKMETALVAAINNPETIQKMEDIGAATVCMSGEEYVQYLTDLRTEVLGAFGIAA